MVLLLLAAASGLVIGALLGALGGGGSILTVPVLVYMLHQPAHSATLVSLLVVGSTAGVGAVAHGRSGRVRLGDGLLFGILGAGGSVIGSRLSAGVSPATLLGAFSVLMVVAAVAMFRRADRRFDGGAGRAARERPRVSASVAPSAVGSDTGVAVVTHPAPVAVRARRPWPIILAAASGVGLLTGFFGVGGGFVVVPVLVLVLGYAMPEAVGTSLVVIAVNSAVALVSRLGTPVHVDWAVVGVCLAATASGALLGAPVAGRISPARLGRSFAVVLLVVAGYTLVRTLSA
jgi:uncharacterized membrane protein YfcA